MERKGKEGKGGTHITERAGRESGAEVKMRARAVGERKKSGGERGRNCSRERRCRMRSTDR
eukprot:1873156-Pleurochrysis_carterae.AAC.1